MSPRLPAPIEGAAEIRQHQAVHANANTLTIVSMAGYETHRFAAASVAGRRKPRYAKA